jgi:hypothetical protein
MTGDAPRPAAPAASAASPAGGGPAGGGLGGGGTGELRAAVNGLLGFAATREQVLLAQAPAAEAGTAARWAAVPLVAHNTEFRRQQVRRLEAIRCGDVPPEFGEIDHASAATYGGYASQPATAVAAASWQSAGDLLAGLAGTADADLLDPARNPWLRGRQLWLQVTVRGFWHPLGHLGEYYLAHGQSGRAVSLAADAVATAASVGAPAMARGMASYNLACAQAGAGEPDAAVVTLTEAITLNPDVRANAARDPDLAGLRDSGQLTALLGS